MDRIHLVTVIQNKKSTIIECSEQETILEAMIRQDLFYRSDCGGRGTCGKCKVRVVSGALKVTTQDKVLFTGQELRDGARLACKAMPQEDTTIALGDVSDDSIKGIVQGTEKAKGTDTVLFRNIDLDHKYQTVNYYLGIDLGTTTLAFRLADNSLERTLATHTMVNPQRAYGADVISRIKASNDGKGEQLKEMIRKALEEGINTVLNSAQLTIHKLSRIAIAGNTTMIHLLMGYSCNGLGLYPFTPVTVDTIHVNTKDIFSGLNAKNVPVSILPCISAFVGGDIAAGLAVCGYQSAEDVSLLIDFGTNGELALGNKDRILVTSTAAGPAFEGGNLSCGVGSIPGAINHVSIHENKITFETIEHLPAVGICGTGAVELLSELYRTGIIDETGLLSGDYFDSGFPICEQGKEDKRYEQDKQYQRDRAEFILTQKDIRELQMAKAAVRAGIEVLMRRYGVSCNQVDKVYLAGGFGFYLDADKAIRIGLLPEAFRNKIFTIGNSSLTGAVMSMTDTGFLSRSEEIITRCNEIHLSNDEAFQELYLKYMYF